MVKKRKSYTWIIVSLAIVLIIWGILHYIENKDREKIQKTISGIEVTTFPVTSELSHVDMIEIQYPSESKYVQLKKDIDNLWHISLNDKMYLAEQQTVNQIVEEIVGFKTDSLIAQGESNYATYMVDDENAVRVTAEENGAKLFDILIGKYNTQSGKGQTFVRLAGQNGIYSVNSFLRASFQPDPAYYRNKRLSNISHRKMKSIEFNYPADSSFTCTRSEAGFWLVDGKPGREEELEKFTGTLGFLMSGNYADETNVILPATPFYTLIITGTEPEAFQIDAYYVNNKWYVKSSYDKQTLWDATNTDLIKRTFPSKKSLTNY